MHNRFLCRPLAPVMPQFDEPFSGSVCRRHSVRLVVATAAWLRSQGLHTDSPMCCTADWCTPRRHGLCQTAASAGSRRTACMPHRVVVGELQPERAVVRLLRGQGFANCASLQHSGPIRQGGPCLAARVTGSHRDRRPVTLDCCWHAQALQLPPRAPTGNNWPSRASTWPQCRSGHRPPFRAPRRLLLRSRPRLAWRQRHGSVRADLRISHQAALLHPPSDTPPSASPYSAHLHPPPTNSSPSRVAPSRLPGQFGQDGAAGLL